MKKIQPEEGKSADIVVENIARLKELFPDAFTEGGVNFDVLRQLLGDVGVLDEGEEKYGLNWHGKKKARQIALTPSTGTLLPCPEESVDWDTTKNLFIEGDNLEVLKLLQKSYANKVKMIYIDPPYNTGKEFIYPDKFQENLNTYLKYTGQVDDEGMKFSSNTETNGRFHSDWLSMIYPRLKLARNLLRDDGVIFISIDDGEVGNLRKCCDEVFGVNNFVANVVWQKKYTRANDARWFSDNHDHILCYAKEKIGMSLNLLLRNENQLSAYSNPDDHPKGSWKATPLHAKSGANTSPYNFKNGVVWAPPTGTFRRFNDATMKKMDDSNEIWFGKDGSQTPSRKSFLSEVKDGVSPVTIWPYDEVGHNHEANNELKSLDMGGLFSNPKPTRLIQRILELSTRGGDIILDFFAGSATTAHAVMQLNAEDGGNRKFIMVQLPEPCDEKSEAFKAGYKTIAEISKERIRRVINKIRTEQQEHKTDLGFKTFKLSNSNIHLWNPDRTDLEKSLLSHQEHLIEGRTEQDILYELLLKRGVDLAASIESRKASGKNIYSIGYGVLFACLDESITKEQVEDIAQTIITWHGELAPDSDTHVFFRDSAFRDDISKTNMAAILEQNGITHVRSL